MKILLYKYDKMIINRERKKKTQKENIVLLPEMKNNTQKVKPPTNKVRSLHLHIAKLVWIFFSLCFSASVIYA